MKQYLIVIFIALLLHPHPSHSHNGAVAIAVPVEGIVVDGDLSDWPERMHVYPIRENTDAYGTTDLSGTDLDISVDFSPEFIVSYSLEKQLIYVGVWVRDDQVEINIGAPSNTDACEVYLDVRHGSMPFQYTMSPEGGSYRSSGTNPSLSQQELGGWDLPIGRTRTQGAVGRVDDITVYEWAFELLGDSLEDSRSLTPNMAIGFEVVAVDKDADGDPSAWISWTPQGHGYKYQDPLALGDLLLVEQDLTLESMLTLLQKARSNVSRIIWRTSLSMAFFTAVPLSFAFLHLVLFLFYPRSRANLYFAIFVSGLAYFVSQGLGGGGNMLSFLLINLSLLGGGLLFFYSLFYPRLPRQFWFFLAAIVGVVIVPVWRWVIMACAVEVLRVVLMALVKRKEEAWVIGLGTIAMMVGSIYTALWFQGILPGMPVLNNNLFFLYLGILGLILSMSLSLARSFARTSKSLEQQLVQVKELSSKTIEQERRIRDEEIQRQLLEEELQTAHDLQMGLMPKDSPNIKGFDISGRCFPANHVGGDFFQYFPISDNRLAISLADVTGHAMEAAVPVMMFSGILKSQMELGDSIEDLFGRLNRTLHGTLDKRTFVCFAMGELDTVTRKCRLSNSGFPYPYHYGPSHKGLKIHVPFSRCSARTDL